MGLDALNILRIESGLIFSGYEFCSQIDPFMAGIGFSVFVTREEDFIGKTALKRIKDGAGTHVMVGLSVEVSIFPRTKLIYKGNDGGNPCKW